MDDSKKRIILGEGPCEVRFDAHTRRLYATDASLYQIDPFGVAFPKSPEEVVWLVSAAQEAEVPLIPRGAGTGLAGGAVGSGVIVDLARYNKNIFNFNRDEQTVWVQPGVVLDNLNAYLKPFGLCFGPDVATSSRATLGGMIGNNSSGARSPLYGTTADNIISLDVVLSDGRQLSLGDDIHSDSALRNAINLILDGLSSEAKDRFPLNQTKRCAGYGIDRYLRSNHNLVHIICGSEGTLAIVTAAKLRLTPLPKKKALLLLFFPSVIEALRASATMDEFQPAAIEHIDRHLFDQTKGQLAFKTTREMLGLDEFPCESILIIEFYDEAEDRIETLRKQFSNIRSIKILDPTEMEMVWALRKAGLSLLTSRKGAAKPVPGLEDVAVLPRQLPDYVAAVQDIMKRLGLEGSFYGHAGAGLLHFRPIIDCRKAEDITKYRVMAQEIFNLATSLHASIAGEHGVGIARTEFM